MPQNPKASPLKLVMPLIDQLRPVKRWLRTGAIFAAIYSIRRVSRPKRTLYFWPELPRGWGATITRVTHLLGVRQAEPFVCRPEGNTAYRGEIVRAGVQ